MRRFLVIVSLLTVFTALSAHKPDKGTQYPDCYEISTTNSSYVPGFLSATGYGMAMQGYTNLSFDYGCEDDFCNFMWARVCGTPPAQPISFEGIEKSYSYPIKEMDKLKEDCRRIITIDKGIMKGVTSKDGIIIMTYLIPK